MCQATESEWHLGVANTNCHRCRGACLGLHPKISFHTDWRQGRRWTSPQTRIKHFLKSVLPGSCRISLCIVYNPKTNSDMQILCLPSKPNRKKCLAGGRGRDATFEMVWNEGLYNLKNHNGPLCAHHRRIYNVCFQEHACATKRAGS
jgi:hypothetical protein